jgi:hypothetical protein
MEPRFGVDFSAVRIHANEEADAQNRALDSRAFTHGGDIFLRRGEYTPGSADGNRLLAHELTHTIQQRSGSCPPSIQREMKFEFQTTNQIFRNNGRSTTLLDRKYGPEDFLVKGTSGVTLESETNGVLEFETRWDRKWSKLQAQIAEAFDMTTQMNAATDLGGGHKEFPFDVGGLRTGTKKEMTAGRWDVKPGMEGGREKILRKGENLEVGLTDSAWDAAIQTSESFELGQYESYLLENEFPDYREPVIASAQAIIDAANKTLKIDAGKLVNLKNFVEIVVNYIMRGEGGSKSDAAGAYADVEGMPSKQAFVLMNRTNFASIYKELLSADEKKLFNAIVRDGVILTKMGLTKKSPFFVKGYGTASPQKGPTVHAWLTGIVGGKDLLAAGTGPGLSAAMGRFKVNMTPGKKDTGLVKFEGRARPVAAGGVHANAADWETYAHDLFQQAVALRPRSGSTALEDTP